ncbi:hypothetical protein DT603_06060 [Pseudoxanthomonas gei]|uniref:Uncharacterized protein n=1 Tax=Pseudoxanthomonas gei TaxID=1383030 RepID=A0ABX0AA94_9GAMM|nr:hypothetical protein [Pseudoxanthomonas gei]NDK38406.1 hypothetical protein [Pseudoxanthomonas gei]
MFQKIVLIAMTLLMTAACSPVAARALVDVSVVDRDTGEWLREYPHGGDVWVAGTPGNRYGVRLTNTTGERVLVVLSVDGVNAVTGQTASPSQAGYVLEPWESAEIAGWRKSLDDIAQFVFTDLGDSYAARTGRPRDVGVIGVAVFQESRPRYYPAPSLSRGGDYERVEARAPGAPAASANGMAAERQSAEASSAADAVSGARQSLGTGHGQREWAPVGQTSFVRATRSPVQVSELRYDEPRRLMAIGAMPQHYPAPYRDRGEDRPRSFPNGFVADPYR